MRPTTHSIPNRFKVRASHLRNVLVIFMVFFLIACTYALGSGLAGPPVFANQLEQSSPSDLPAELSCSKPTAENLPICDAQEQKILSSTVRLMFLGTDPVNIGHGTVISGRYVITHNHYPSFQPGITNDGRLATHISLTLANGEYVLQNIPLSNYTVISVDPGILILDLRTVGREGFFDHIGIPSAPLAVFDPASIRSGTEVAQVNWDGETTFVEWVRVSSIRDAGSTPALELENFIELGASGGGVFYGGYHIANNWLQGMLFHTDTQELARRYSVAAANTAESLSLIANSAPFE